MAHLYKICVDPLYRGQKIAKEMFEELGYKVDDDYEFAYENNKYIIEVSEKEAELQNKHYDKYGFFVWGTIDDNYIRNYDVTIARHIADGRHF